VWADHSWVRILSLAQRPALSSMLSLFLVSNLFSRGLVMYNLRKHEIIAKIIIASMIIVFIIIFLTYLILDIHAMYN